MFDIANTTVTLSNTNLSTTNPPLFQILSNLITAVKELQTKNQIDFGQGYLLSTDANGTRVNFNKSFTQPVVVIATMVDTANDMYVTIMGATNTFFTAKATKNDATRQSGIINWIAYGPPKS